MADFSKKHDATAAVEDTRMGRNIVQLEVPIEKSDSTDPEHLCAPNLSPEQQRRLWRKVDMRILPILSALYLCCYLDRGMFRMILKQMVTSDAKLVLQERSVCPITTF